jgi:hypothetical protein
MSHHTALKGRNDPIDRHSAPQRGQRLVSFFILGGGLLTILAAAYLMWVSYSVVPGWDEWTPIHDLATSQHPLPISWLWSQHNEHRIPFYRILLLADFRLFHGKHWVFFVAMFAVQLAFLGLLAWLLRVIGGLQGVLWRTGVGLAAYCLFCPSQWENFSWAFQISFLLPGFFVGVGLVSLLLHERSPRTSSSGWGYLAFSILAGSAATYSNANGVIAWPVLIVAAVALRVRFRVIVAYMAAGFLLVISYLHGYTSPGYHGSPLESLHHPLVIAEYVAKYFGGSWAHHYRPSIAVIIGIAGIALGLGLALRVLAMRNQRPPLPIALVGLMFFSLGTAFVTALGRMNFGTDQAFSSRYQTFSLLFWFSLGMLLMSFLTEKGWRIAVTLLLAIIALMMLSSAGQYRFPLQAARSRAWITDVAGSAFLADVRDPKSATELFPPGPDWVWDDVRYLQQHQLSVFSSGLNSGLGQPLVTTDHAGSQSTCLGNVDLIESVTGPDSDAWHIAGWAVDPQSRKPVRRVIAAVDGRIEGFGVVGLARPDVRRALRTRRALDSGWSGFLRSAGKTMIDVYGVVDASNEKLCRIGSVPVPAR